MILKQHPLVSPGFLCFSYCLVAQTLSACNLAIKLNLWVRSPFGS